MLLEEGVDLSEARVREAVRQSKLGRPKNPGGLVIEKLRDRSMVAPAPPPPRNPAPSPDSLEACTLRRLSRLGVDRVLALADEAAAAAPEPQRGEFLANRRTPNRSPRLLAALAALLDERGK